MAPLFGLSLSERMRRSMSELSPLGASIETIPTLLATSSIDLRNAEELLPGSGLYTIPICSRLGAASFNRETQLPPRDGSNGVKSSRIAARARKALEVMHFDGVADHGENGRNVRMLSMQCGHGS